MKCQTLLLLFLLTLTSFNFKNDKHPIYVSVAEVDYFSAKREVQVALRIFTDDLESAIRDKGNRLNLDTSKETKDADSYIKKYLDDNFKIKANEKQALIMNFIGKEYIDDVTWLYFKYENTPKKVKSLTIKNSVIIDLHTQQKNLTHLKKDRQLIKSKHLNKKRSTITIAL